MQAAPRTSFLDVIGWAAFLAASWTWCIGMFLPVLLVRDFGPKSFAIFAVPNVMGAALMGAVLHRSGASESVVRHHGVACWAFSFITVAFQAFFVCWLIFGLDAAVPRWVLVPMLFVIPFLMRAEKPSPLTRLISILVLIISLAAGVWWLRHASPAASIEPARLPQRDLLWLAPVCVLGFALCPYLDLTFHSTRQNAKGPPGTAAFILGFGVFFFAMILLTLLYAGPLLQRAQDGGRSVQPGLAPAPIVLHMSVQLVFTIMLHKSWLEADPSPAGPRAPANASLLALVMGVAAAIFGLKLPDSWGLSGPELVYRLFMAFYGLVFPAYVWTCMLPLGSAPSRTRLITFLTALGIAGPMYWLGFVQSQTWWLAPGILVILVAGLVAREPRPAAD
jgi:hypothetical protein